MKNIVRNLFVLVVVMITLFVTIYYSIVYATNGYIMFDYSDITIIIFFGILSIIIISIILLINSKLNLVLTALEDISDKIDISEENMVNLERSTQRVLFKEIKGNKDLKGKLIERECYEEKSEQQQE